MNSTSAEVALSCGYSDDNVILAIIQTEMNYNNNITTSCNAMEVLTSLDLMPSTDYIINITVNRLSLPCTVQHFRTEGECMDVHA